MCVLLYPKTFGYRQIPFYPVPTYLIALNCNERAEFNIKRSDKLCWVITNGDGAEGFATVLEQEKP